MYALHIYYWFQTIFRRFCTTTFNKKSFYTSPIHHICKHLQTDTYCFDECIDEKSDIQYKHTLTTPIHLISQAFFKGAHFKSTNWCGFLKISIYSKQLICTLSHVHTVSAYFSHNRWTWGLCFVLSSEKNHVMRHLAVEPLEIRLAFDNRCWLMLGSRNLMVTWENEK